MLHKIIIMILIIISFSFVDCRGFEVKLEYDKHMSIDACVINAKTVYDTLSLIESDCVRFNMLIDFVSAWTVLSIGHEYSHGYSCRLKGIDYDIDLYPPMIHTNIKDPYMNVCKSIGGITFENNLKKEIVKNQINNNNMSYKDSVIISTIKSGFIGTAHNKSVPTNDLITISNSWKKLNPKTRLSRNSIESCIYETTLLDPMSLINYAILGSTIWNGEKDIFKLKMKIIPTYDFNLYPTAITREIGLSKIFNKHQYMKLTYEFGQDIWNEKIDGFSFEYNDIPICGKSIDIKIHNVDKCVSNTLLTLNFENIYFRWKHHIKQYNDLESTDRFSVGLKF